MWNSEQVRKFLKTVEELIAVVNNHRGQQETCAWVCIRDRTEGDKTMVLERVGGLPEDSDQHCKTAARRKVEILEQNPGSEVSYTHRNPDAGDWGGGVSLDQQLDVAISGLPEEIDTAVVIFAASRVMPIEQASMRRLAGLSDRSGEWLELFMEGEVDDEDPS